MQKAIHQGVFIESQQDFDSFKASVDQDIQERFHEEFYILRYDLAANHREQWLALNEAYPGVREAIPQLADSFRLSVATSKDRETVIAMLKDWRLFDLFGEQFVLDKRSGPSKQIHLGVLRERFGCQYSQMSFIDDKVSHLIDCAALGVRTIMSGWGYNGPAERAQAAEQGFEILELGGLATLTP